MCFLHLFPKSRINLKDLNWKQQEHFCFVSDVHEAFDHVLDEIEDTYHTKVDYPVAEFVIVFGFFVVLILEQIVLDCKEGWQKVIILSLFQILKLNQISIHNRTRWNNCHNPLKDTLVQWHLSL